MDSFLWLLGAAILITVGVISPTFIMVLFLSVVVLFPKLPLIQIADYLVPIRIEDFLLAFALFSLLLRLIIRGEKPVPNPLFKWMLLYALTTSVSFLFGWLFLHSVPDPRIGFLFWLRAPEYFSASLLSLFAVSTWKSFRQLLIALVGVVSLVGVYGLLQEFSIVPVFDAMHSSGEIVVVRFFPDFGEERLFSTFAGPYDLAAFYLLVIPICLALLTSVNSRRVKFALSSVLALSSFCFYMTYARTPLVAMAVALFVCLVLLDRTRTGFVLGFLCVIPAFLLGGFRERLTYALNDPFATFALGGRLQLNWVDAFEAIVRSPFLGTGPASLFEGMGVDSLYILLLGTWGIFGLACFMALIYKALRHQYQTIRESQDKLGRALAIGLFAGTIGLLVNALTIDTFFASKVAFLYWFLMGLLFSGRALEKKTFAKQTQLSPNLPQGEGVPQRTGLDPALNGV